MKQGFQLAARGLVREHPGAQCCTVQPTRGVEHLGAEQLDDRRQCRLARRHHLTRHLVECR